MVSKHDRCHSCEHVFTSCHLVMWWIAEFAMTLHNGNMTFNIFFSNAQSYGT